MDYHQTEQFSAKVKEGMLRARKQGKSIGGFVDLTGQPFGKLKVEAQASNGKCGRVRWHCKCECGNTTVAFADNLSAGRTKSCGCKQGTRENSPINCLLYRYITAAKKRNLPFLLSREEFTVYLSGDCYYCGITPNQNVTVNCPGHPEFRYNGIDRVDSSLGYTIDNSVSCCGICNRMKWDKSKDNFLAQVHKINEFQTQDKVSAQGAIRWTTYLSEFKNTSRSCPQRPWSPVNTLFNEYKLSAERRKYEFGLSKSTIAVLFQSDCCYCGSAPVESRFKNHGHAAFRWNGIDRIDSSLGYVEGNVVPCCKFCNEMKSNKSRDKFLQQVKAIYRHRVGLSASS